MLIKRQDRLFVEWYAGAFHILAPADARTKLQMNAAAISAIGALDDWTDADAFLATLTSGSEHRSQAAALLDQLMDHGVIVTKDAVRLESRGRLWDQWGSVAELFHTHSRNAPYLVADEEKQRSIKTLGSAEAPATFKSYPGRERVHLPEPDGDLDIAYGEVLRLRRTHRHFTDTPVPLGDLAALLHLTFGPQRFCDGGVFGIHQLRTSPNAGARHEIECYVAVRNVESVPRGVYHYNAQDHALDLLVPEADDELLQHLLYGQPFSKSAPLICFTTAVAERISHKYQDGRAYRLWLLNVGHVGQTFALTATALGLGAFQTAAFRDSETDELLGLDPAAEFTTYVLGCGFVPDLQAPEGITFTDHA